VVGLVHVLLISDHPLHPISPARMEAIERAPSHDTSCLRILGGSTGRLAPAEAAMSTAAPAYMSPVPPYLSV
jgi:hypothetical protein